MGLPVQVKRRYLDWRALMKKKRLRAELCFPSSLTVKTERDESSPEHQAAPRGFEQLIDLSGFQKDCKSYWPELAALSEASSVQSETAHLEVKIEDDVGEYKV